MSEQSAARQRQADSRNRLHLTTVISVLTGVALLVGGAFLLSYAGIHEMALFAGVSPSLAALYPLMFDITLVIACVAALTLRGARWWMRVYAACSLTILLGVVAVAEAVHSAGIGFPYGPAAATFAVLPWALFLIGFTLGLLVLRYLRTTRAKARAARAVAVTAPVSNTSAVVPPPGQRVDQPRLRINDRHTPDAGVAPPERTPATPASPKPSPSQHAGTPADVTSAAPSEHRHGLAHRHHHRAGEDHAESS